MLLCGGELVDAKELKFLLKLVGFPEYHASITKLKPNPKTKAAERDSICRSLAERELIEYSTELEKVKTAPPGKALLKQDTTGLPISSEELKALRNAEEPISPGKTGIDSAKRHQILSTLIERGLLKAEKTKIKDVWLTQRGETYLREEYTPTGTPTISLELLGNYLRLLRKSSGELPGETLPESHQTATAEEDTIPHFSEPPSDEEILNTIAELDRQHQTENYLPIFYLRQKLQPPMTREDVDSALYRLQKQDKIELSSLQETHAYTTEQIEAGIEQNVGGPLFFIILLK
jgi:hypothetical protein